MDMSAIAIRFPPSEVAAKIAVSLGIGLLVGIEREWSNKDLGARTLALTAVLLPTNLDSQGLVLSTVAKLKNASCGVRFSTPRCGRS
jgi:hypothetical protein